MKSTKNSVPEVPFEHFFTYAEVERFLKEMASSRPNLTKLTSLGKSREGREIWCLTVTDFRAGAPEDKPAYVIHGNIHAVELSGTHAALYTARELLAGYPQKTKILQPVAFHIIPRINPDGAEVVATNSGVVRSRIDRSSLPPNTLVQKDIDGNGIVVSMRVQRPDGAYIADPKDSRLMMRREPDSKGPFYRMFPEGEIVQWDGSDNITVEGRYMDWNRQWAYDWKPEPEQGGSGDFPYSEPEMRAFAEFVTGRPNIFGILGYHTGPAAFLRPPSSPDDNALDEGDVRKMEEFGAVAKKHTGLPCVPVYRYCEKKSRGATLHGHFPTTGYQHWGLFVFEFELGRIMDSAGMDFDTQLSWGTDEERQAGERRLMRWWDRRGRKPLIFLPWKRFNHPQLGPVEIGGEVWSARAGMTMPDLKKRCAGTYQFTLHHAAQHPHVSIENVEAKNVAGDVWRIRARIANRGAFPTHVSNRGAKLSRLRTVCVQFSPDQDAELLSLTGHQDIGHLAGLTGSRRIEWFVRARKGAACCIEAKGGTGGNCAQTVRLTCT
jgi:hypothetical protein